MKAKGLIALAAFVLMLSGAPAPAASTAPLTVHIADMKYAPESLKVHVGAVVRFVNDDGVAHTVTSTDKSFDSGNLGEGKSWTHTFTAAGTYTYLCTYHTFMTGTVTVEP